MKAKAIYYIETQNVSNGLMIVRDENPGGTTITIEDDGRACEFNLPRQEMIEALEYLLMKIKARV